jgi:glutamyl-tRNA synthetase
MSVRVRFAPSPTGYLHVGGARTALFNWLFARKEGGSFVLRVEDTDRERSDETHVRAILQGMRWLGLDWDEGPHFQSQGLERHRRDALRLVAEGAAYPDFTDPAAIKEEAAESGVDPSRLARKKAEAVAPAEAARRADSGEPHAIRFRVPEGETTWNDLVHGSMRFDNADLDDLVLLRTDGSPTYNLAVVSDDAEMRITHVIRGDDHLSNTPKQILLYGALGRPIPVFGHVPLILGPDGRRLSKRHGATAVGAYEEEGILPGAMVNFLALLGWSPGDDREVMSIDEIIAAFSTDRILKKSSVFDVEKLRWLNGQHLAREPLDALVPRVEAALERRGVRPPGHRDAAWFETLLDLLVVRSRTVEDLVDQAIPYVVESRDLELDPAAVAKHWERDLDGVRDRLRRLRDIFVRCEWTEEDLETALRGLAEELGIGAGRLIHPLRVALTGRTTSPGIFDVLLVLGREAALDRLNRSLDRLATLP